LLQRFHAAVGTLTEAIRTNRVSVPGLYFGKMGIAVALLEAAHAGLIGPPDTTILAACRSDRLDWPDLTHGAAGQGVGALNCSALTSDPVWLGYADSCVEHLLFNQREDGTWQLPEGVDGMSGDVLTGFAHGIAGILYFLCQYQRRFPDRRVQRAICRAEQALLNLGSTTETGARVWPYSLKHAETWRWWCHGSPGIALTYLALFETTDDEIYAHLARDALKAIPELVSSPNLSQCHGLAGLGEIYLEAARVLNEPIWQDRADGVSAILIASARRKRGGIVWPVEKAEVFTADLMLGCAGVIHFLVRNALRPRGWGPPLLLGPCCPL
jgi:lantibiotic modifying enzyme